MLAKLLSITIALVGADHFLKMGIQQFSSNVVMSSLFFIIAVAAFWMAYDKTKKLM